MKRQTTILMLALVSLAMMLTSCETTLTPQKGKPVRFTVSSKAGTQTKTSYSGSVENGIERIDWVVNDTIRVVSSDGNKVSTPAGERYYDYTIANVSDRGHFSDAKLADIGNTNGLLWASSNIDEVTFYGIYPKVQPTYSGTNGIYVNFHGMTIPAAPTLTWGDPVASGGITTVTGKPDMKNAYMISAPAKYDTQADEGKEVHMDFYPLFNAFEVDLASKDKELELTQLQLISTSSKLAGSFDFSSHDNSGDYLTADGPSVDGLEVDASSTSTLTIDLTGKTISTTEKVHFTVLALPGELTDMTLAVTFKDPRDATGNTLKTRKLKLQQNGSYITFPAFHKARLNGLAVDTGENWELTVKTDVNEWKFYSEELSALDQINVAPVEPGAVHTVKVTGAIETTAEWKAEPGHNNSSNHELPNDVPETDETYYSRYYQIRTLNWNLPTNKQFFEMSFTPTAPIGGYWQMVPEAVGNQNSLDHFRFEVMIEGVTEFEEQETPHGQIMNRRVFVRIYPKDYSGELAINVYEIIMRCYFSPNIHFDPAYSADSELQDIHGNGQFSIWRFRLDSGATGDYTPGNPEHDSDKL